VRLDQDEIVTLADELCTRLEPRLVERITAPQEDGWLDSQAAADYLGISVNALHKLTSANRLTFSQTCKGAPCFFKRSHLDAYRERFLVAGSQPPC
jgi:hypothetical protein